jgi:hypothetical protein
LPVFVRRLKHPTSLSRCDVQQVFLRRHIQAASPTRPPLKSVIVAGSPAAGCGRRKS